jgi:glutamate-1-semialdehyde 2,1-aminomutase
MLDRGYLAGPSFYPTLAHTPERVERFAEQVDAVFAAIRGSLERGSVKSDLRGPVAHSGFRRLT